MCLRHDSELRAVTCGAIWPVWIVTLLPTRAHTFPLDLFFLTCSVDDASSYVLHIHPETLPIFRLLPGSLGFSPGFGFALCAVDFPVCCPSPRVGFRADGRGCSGSPRKG